MTTSARRLPAQALRGVRVLDFSHVIAGPFATFHLAQMGADVVKVERPDGGDVMRHASSGERGFTALNAGKRLVTIDIASDAGRAEAMALADRIAVMNEGRIVQLGTPWHIYQQPASRFVAGRS